jgi:hypothetical protein
VPIRDLDIRVALASHLEKRFSSDPGTLILHELGIASGSSRVDLAVINGKLHGFEIKSDFDTLRRLPSQSLSYNAVFDQMTLVLGTTRKENLSGIIPDWWGIVRVDGSLKLKVLRRGKKNPSRNALALAKLLWREEALSFIENRGSVIGLRSKPRTYLFEQIARDFTLNEIATFVRQALKAREGWRSDALRIPDGDSSLPDAT